MDMIKEFMAESGWERDIWVLKFKRWVRFLLGKAKITHVWTQSKAESEKISKATHIKNICDNYEDMIGEVDAVIIARDDYKLHCEMAKPFWDWVISFCLGKAFVGK